MNKKLEFNDAFYNKLSGDFANAQPQKILYCFSKPSTGSALCKIATLLLREKTQEGEITGINIVTEAQAAQIEDIDKHKQEIFSAINTDCEKEDILHRSFLEISDNFVYTILSTAQTYECSLILMGMGHTLFNDAVWNKIVEHIPPETDDATYQNKIYNPENTESFSNGVSSLIERNPHATGILLLRDFDMLNQIFILILDREDVHTFIYVSALLANEEMTFTLWDAIGIFDHDNELNKLLKKAQKKHGERLKFWNNNEKIDIDFIHSIDLAIIGIKGWSKLINSAIPWKNNLPSTLIFKPEKL